MQRFEDFGLMGTRNPSASPARLAAMSDAMVRRALDEMTKQHRREVTAAPPRRTVKPARAVSPVLETRPAVRVVPGGPASIRGRDAAWALRELRSASPAQLKAQIRRDPELWARAMINLDRLTAQLHAEQWDGRC